MDKVDAHWANVPLTRIPPAALACSCVSLPLLSVASWMTVQAEEPIDVLPWTGPMVLVSMVLFGTFLVLCARSSHASGSRPRAKYGLCVVDGPDGTHGPFPDEDAADAWAGSKYDHDTRWTVRPFTMVAPAPASA